MSALSDGRAVSTDDDAPADTEVHANARQSVVLVDENDEPQGVANRLDAHTGEGMRHRAFTCLVFDGDGRLLLAQRAPDKSIWDTH